MQARHEIDGSVTLTLDDGRKFILNGHQDGTFTLESVDGGLLISPISRNKFEIDTPLT